MASDIEQTPKISVSQLFRSLCRIFFLPGCYLVTKPVDRLPPAETCSIPRAAPSYRTCPTRHEWPGCQSPDTATAAAAGQTLVSLLIVRQPQHGVHAQLTTSTSHIFIQQPQRVSHPGVSSQQAVWRHLGTILSGDGQSNEGLGYQAFTIRLNALGTEWSNVVWSALDWPPLAETFSKIPILQRRSVHCLGLVFREYSAAKIRCTW